MKKFFRTLRDMGNWTGSHPIALTILFVCWCLNTTVVFMGIPGGLNTTLKEILVSTENAWLAFGVFNVILIIAAMIAAIAALAEIIAVSFMFNIVTARITNKYGMWTTFMILIVGWFYLHHTWNGFLTNSLISAFEIASLTPAEIWIDQAMLILTLVQMIAAVFIGLPLKIIADMVNVTLLDEAAMTKRKQIRILTTEETAAKVRLLRAGQHAGGNLIGDTVSNFLSALSPDKFGVYTPTQQELAGMAQNRPWLNQFDRRDVKVLPGNGVALDVDRYGFTRYGRQFIGENGGEFELGPNYQPPALVTRGGNASNPAFYGGENNVSASQRSNFITPQNSAHAKNVGPHSWKCGACGGEITSQRGQTGGQCPHCGQANSFQLS